MSDTYLSIRELKEELSLLDGNLLLDINRFTDIPVYRNDDLVGYLMLTEYPIQFMTTDEVLDYEQQKREQQVKEKEEREEKEKMDKEPDPNDMPPPRTA